MEHGLKIGVVTFKIREDMCDFVTAYDANETALRGKALWGPGGRNTVQGVVQLSEAYQAVVMGVLNFSVESPRYGLLDCRDSANGFVVTL